MADVPPRVAPLEGTDPSRIGPYALTGRLGTGGMGTVYLGRAGDGRLVAVKAIRREFAQDPRFRARFRREAEAARRVARFCTAEVLDVDTDGAEPYLVTEFIDGPTLAHFVHGNGPLPPSELERLAVAVASALTAIHSAGLIHRDLKPGNILLSSSGARVIDFGIARALETPSVHTAAGGVLGTPAFMSPEQALGHPLTPAADIYAWGGVILFAATGRMPYGEAATPVILFRAVHEEPDLTGLDPPLLELVRQAMSKDPQARPTAAALLLRLAEGPGPPGGPARPALPGEAGQESDVTARVAPPVPVAGTVVGPPSWSRRLPVRLAVALGSLALLAVVVATTVLVGPFDLRGRGTDTASATGTGPTAGPTAGPTGPSAAVVEPTTPADHPGGGSEPVARGWRVFKRYTGSSPVNDSPIIAVDPEGNERQVGTGDNPALSPAADRVVYAGADGEIASVRPDGSDFLRLTDEPDGSADNPVFSPDGTYVAYTRNIGGVFTVNADGTGRRQLADLSDAYDLSWPRAGEILLRRGSDQAVHILSVASGETRLVARSPVRGAAAVEPSWSPDGTRIAFGLSSGGIYLANSDGSGLRQVCDTGCWHPTWSPQGALVLVRDAAAGSFYATTGTAWAMNPDGTGEHQLDERPVSGPVRWSAGR